MITLDKLILHLENLKEYFGSGDIPVTVPIMEDEEMVSFIPVENLSDINIYDLEVDGEQKQGLYIDVLQILEEVKD